jgi:hypothetical protein
MTLWQGEAMSEPTVNGERRAPPRSRWSARILAGIGGVAAAGVSLGLAIWDKREPPRIPQIHSGETVEAGRWSVRLISARAGERTPDGRPAPSGRVAVIVDLSLENRTAETSNLYYDVLKIADLPAGADAKPTLYLDRDRELLSALQPRLPERVSAAWLWPAGAPPPERLDLTIQAERFKPRDNLYAAPLWTDRHAVAAASLAVAQGAEP